MAIPAGRHETSKINKVTAKVPNRAVITDQWLTDRSSNNFDPPSTKKNPGALAGGTEVQSTYEAAKLLEHDTPEPCKFATFFWCKASGSVERLSGYPRGVAV